MTEKQRDLVHYLERQHTQIEISEAAKIFSIRTIRAAIRNKFVKTSGGCIFVDNSDDDLAGYQAGYLSSADLQSVPVGVRLKEAYAMFDMGV